MVTPSAMKKGMTNAATSSMVIGLATFIGKVDAGLRYEEALAAMAASSAAQASRNDTGAFGGALATLFVPL